MSITNIHLKKKVVMSAIIAITLIVLGGISYIYRDNRLNTEINEQRTIQGQQGAKAIIHTKVLKVTKNQITVQEVYPYTDNSGKTHPIQTFDLIPSEQATYFRRFYPLNSDEIATIDYTDKQGLFDEIRPEMLLSAVVTDSPYAGGKVHAPLIIYSDRFPGVKYSFDEKVTNGSGK